MDIGIAEKEIYYEPVELPKPLQQPMPAQPEPQYIPEPQTVPAEPELIPA